MNDPVSTTTSSSSMTSDPPTEMDHAYIYAMFTIRLMITAIGMLGNSLIIVVICTSHVLRNESDSYLYMGSLAVADLVISLFVMPIGLHLSLTSGRWSLSHMACNFFISLDVHLTTVSLLQLAVMTLDRYLAVCYPYRHLAIKRKYAVAMIAGCWVLPSTISFLPVMSGWHQRSDSDLSSMIGFCTFAVNIPYMLTAGVLSFLIPTIVVLALNLRLYLVARRQARAVQAQEAGLGSLGQPEGQLGGHTREHRSSLQSKATRTVGMLTGCFLLSWWPFVLVNAVYTICGCLPDSALDLSVWFAYSNSALNPFLYLAFNVPFRRAAARLLLCRRCKNSVRPSTPTMQRASTTDALS